MYAAIEATDRAASLYLSTSVCRGGGHVSLGEMRFGVVDGHELRDATDWVLMSRQPMMMPAMVVRRDAYWRVNGQAENLVSREDTHFLLRIGLGAPFCAVGHFAGEATSDDMASLTRSVDARSLSYWECTRWLYDDILARFPELAGEHRRELRRRLAEAHIELCKLAVRHNPGLAAIEPMKGLRVDRQAVLARAKSRVYGRRS